MDGNIIALRAIVQTEILQSKLNRRKGDEKIMDKLNNLEETLLIKKGQEPKSDKTKTEKKAQEIYDRMKRVFCDDSGFPLEEVPDTMILCLKLAALEISMLEDRLEQMISRTTSDHDVRGGHDMPVPVDRPPSGMAGS
jgi:hypothetical protein